MGAMFAYEKMDVINNVIKILSEAPSYKDKKWLTVAYQALNKFPPGQEGRSLGIPTWFYGHEPPTPFASHIAKYFSNSVREEGLITLAVGGIVFAPGSAGTIQEIFQDAAQNHYATKGSKISPMVFLDKEYWTQEKPVYPLLEELAKSTQYESFITIANAPCEIVKFIQKNPPVEGKRKEFVFCDDYC